MNVYDLVLLVTWAYYWESQAGTTRSRVKTVLRAYERHSPKYVSFVLNNEVSRWLHRWAAMRPDSGLGFEPTECPDPENHLPNTIPNTVGWMLEIHFLVSFWWRAGVPECRFAVCHCVSDLRPRWKWSHNLHTWLVLRLSNNKKQCEMPRQSKLLRP